MSLISCTIKQHIKNDQTLKNCFEKYERQTDREKERQTDTNTKEKERERDVYESLPALWSGSFQTFSKEKNSNLLSAYFK